MYWAKRLTHVFLIGVFLSFFFCNDSIAGEISYTVPPSCNEDEQVKCAKDQDPVCFALDPDIEFLDYYSPICNENSKPTCESITQDNKNTVVECVVKAQCIAGELNTLVPSCPTGMKAKCFGNNNIPDCNNPNPCGKTIAVCEEDKTWTASAL